MTKPFPRLLIAGLLAFSTVATPVMAQTLQPLDRIAAVVNEDVVLQSEMDRAVQNVLAQYANQPGQLPPRAVLERQVLERLVLVKLQVARATESGIRIGDAELNNAINAVAQ
ncbi:MAG: SurA N-terminal domain-containing protein, partial [Pseudoxanthomonas sp.]|nr:SurA N-terminal domain-containing protein [Pseudoxanthomonas sp.]